MKIFIDINIFLDSILKREKYEEALSIFNAVEQQRFEAVVLDITILNIDYIAKKQTQDLREFLVIINRLFKIIGASNLSLKKALELANSDLEDNLQYICAVESKCKVIVTNDKKFINDKVQLMTSDEFYAKHLKWHYLV